MRVLLLLCVALMSIPSYGQDYSEVVVGGFESTGGVYYGTSAYTQSLSSNLAKCMVDDEKTLYDVSKQVRKLTIKDAKLNFLDVCFIEYLCNIDIGPTSTSWYTDCSLNELVLDNVTFAVEDSRNYFSLNGLPYYYEDIISTVSSTKKIKV